MYKQTKEFFMIYGYLRVSTERQTTENQRFEIKNYCTDNEMKIDKWVNETVSGKERFENRKLGKLLKILKKDDVLIFTEFSRLSRTMYPMISALGKCEENGVEVISIKERFRPKRDRTAKYLAPIFAISGEMERDLISQRTTEALARLKANGVKLGRPVGSKSKYKKLSGREKEIKKMLNEKFSQRKMAKKLKVHRKTLERFIAENNFSTK